MLFGFQQNFRHWDSVHVPVIFLPFGDEVRGDGVGIVKCEPKTLIFIELKAFRVRPFLKHGSLGVIRFIRFCYNAGFLRLTAKLFDSTKILPAVVDPWLIRSETSPGIIGKFFL